MRWVIVVYFMDLSLFSCVLSEHTIHNKSYYSPLSSERGWGRGCSSLQSLRIGVGGRGLFSVYSLRIRIGGEAFSLYKKKGAESNSAPFELYVSFVYFILLS